MGLESDTLSYTKPAELNGIDFQKMYTWDEVVGIAGSYMPDDQIISTYKSLSDSGNLLFFIDRPSDGLVHIKMNFNGGAERIATLDYTDGTVKFRFAQ